MFHYLFTGLAIVFACAIVATFFIPSVRTGLWDVGLAAQSQPWSSGSVGC
jgi:hypothetical protein